MEKFWKDIMNCLLGVALYHEELPDEDTWVDQYFYEVQNMIDDIKNFHRSITSAGLEVSNDVMANFLIYAEAEHIGNERLVQKSAVDMNTLLILAAQINDELN